VIWSPCHRQFDHLYQNYIQPQANATSPVNHDLVTTPEPQPEPNPEVTGVWPQGTTVEQATNATIQAFVNAMGWKKSLDDEFTKKDANLIKLFIENVITGKSDPAQLPYETQDCLMPSEMEKLSNILVKVQNTLVPPKEDDSEQDHNDATQAAFDEYAQKIGLTPQDYSPQEIKGILNVIGNLLNGTYSDIDTATEAMKAAVPHLSTMEMDTFKEVMQKVMGQTSSTSFEPDATDKILDSFLDADLQKKNYSMHDLSTIREAITRVLEGKSSLDEMVAEIVAETYFSTYDLDILKNLVKDALDDKTIQSVSNALDAHHKKAMDVAQTLFIPPKTKKAVETSMQSAWAKGNPEKVADWMLKKYHQTNASAWQLGAMELVLKYNYPLEKVPDDLLPPTVKAALLTPQTAQAAPVEPPAITSPSQQDLTFDGMMQIANQMYGGTIYPNSPFGNAVKDLANGNTKSVEEFIHKYSSNKNNTKTVSIISHLLDLYKQAHPEPATNNTDLSIDSLLQMAGAGFGTPIHPTSQIGKAIQKMLDGDSTDLETHIHAWDTHPSPTAKAAKDSLQKVLDTYNQAQDNQQTKPDFNTIKDQLVAKTGPIGDNSATAEMLQACIDTNSLQPLYDMEDAYPQWYNKKGKAVEQIIAQHLKGAAPATPSSTPSTPPVTSPPDFDALMQVASGEYGHKLTPGSILSKVIQQLANGDTSAIKDKLEYFKKNPDSKPYKAYKAVYDLYNQSHPESQSTIAPKADFDTIANDVKNAGYTSPQVGSAAGDMIQACIDSNSLVPFEEFKKSQ
jgi:hypothetical protein